MRFVVKVALRWIWDNRQWLFSGVAVSALLLLFELFRRKRPRTVALTAHERATVATGSNISQSINSPTVLHWPTINLPPPSPPSGTTDQQRYNEWRELIGEIDKSFIQIGYAFHDINVIKPRDDSNDPQAGIQSGLRAISNKLLIADALKQAHILEKYQEIVRYALSAHDPLDPGQQPCPTIQGFNVKARAFQQEITEMAQRDMQRLMPLGVTDGRRQLRETQEEQNTPPKTSTGHKDESEERKKDQSVVDDQPPKLESLMDSDFPRLMKLSGTSSVTFPDSSSLKCSAKLYVDLDSGSKFIGFYVPSSPKTFDVSIALAANAREAGDALQQSLIIVTKSLGENPHDTRTFTYTGRVYLYHDDFLTHRQIADIEDRFRSNGFEVILRGPDHLARAFVAYKGGQATKTK
jgi:hypothetical protein